MNQTSKEPDQPAEEESTDRRDFITATSSVAMAGGLAAGYYGYKEDKGWKYTLTWAGVGLAFPLIVGGFALYKQVRKK